MKCKHLETITNSSDVAYWIECLKCGKQWSEQEYTDFMDKIKFDIHYEYPYQDKFLRDPKTGFTKKILSEIDDYRYE